ncbi:MAG: HAD family phosphatase [Verrucomicrobia bacterium]|nr:HAD family phosphatase [Verrucomicrobiota bacterium]
MKTPIRLLLADVDGTLVTKEKVLTARAVAAVRRLGEAGVAFAITSGRPPRGMAMLIEPLRITTPVAGFNGGLFVQPDDLDAILEERTLGRAVVAETIAIIEQHGLGAWIYQGTDWFVHERHGAHVDKEEWTVKFPPTVVAAYTPAMMERVAKVVGVSDDLDAVARCETAVRARFAGDVARTKQCSPARDDPPSRVSAARSQPYYLDVTHPDANKGAVVHALARMLKIQPAEIATIGDQPNDVLMFEQGGMSIAMGQASDAVKAKAHEVTTSCDDEGFANAIERFILPKSAAQ